MQKRKWLIVLSILMFLGLGGAWLWGAFSGDSKVRELQKQMANNMAKDVPWDQRREQFKNLREQMKELPKEQQEQVMQAGQKFFMRRMEERIDKYFELPPDQRVAELDKQIREME